MRKGTRLFESQAVWITGNIKAPLNKKEWVLEAGAKAMHLLDVLPIMERRRSIELWWRTKHQQNQRDGGELLAKQDALYSNYHLGKGGGRAGLLPVAWCSY